MATGTRFLSAILMGLFVAGRGPAAERYHSDSDARFLHHIDLYDVDNRKITPESNRPFSPMNTCGRCHDYDTIAHGWHFNAFQADSVDGRPGEPWVWTDPKTATQLPLSYRQWPDTFRPQQLGITRWDMTVHFGGRIPGGNMGQLLDGAASDDTAKPTSGNSSAADDADAQSDPGDQDGASQEPSPRWQFSGALQIDCMVCHAVSGAYDFNARRAQIEEENFAWAPTAGLRLGDVDGRVSRIKSDADPDDEQTLDRLPKVQYDARRFNPDGTVFMDLVRHPENNACYQCHSHRTVSDQGIEPRWIHDRDVHLRAGMQCVDCHRNGIDHHIVRGFPGEEHPGQAVVTTLSCAGCHLGAQGRYDADVPPVISQRPGRMGSPYPAHAGIPPLHFDKLSCTACHSGPVPREQAMRMMTSLAHHLGQQGHRTGEELPAIVGPVYAAGHDGRIQPQKAMWPAYWGSRNGDAITPLPPNQVYELTRRALRVRKDFVTEILKPRLGSSDLKEILGDDRARIPDDEWTDEERQLVDQAQREQGQTLFNEKVYAALDAIEESSEIEQAVFVSGGLVYAKGDEEDTLVTVAVPDDDPAVKMRRWPLAHNVRPAGWALGSGGCTDCHRDDAEFFASTVVPVGPAPKAGESFSMSSLQGMSELEQVSWNEMFRHRDEFKYVLATSVTIVIMVICIAIGATVARIGQRNRTA